MSRVPKLLIGLLSSGCLLMAGPAGAQFFSRFDTSAALLDGKGYRLKGDHVTSMKLENANDWAYGDFYGLLRLEKRHDRPDSGETWFLRVRPRFSLDKITSLEFGDGLLRDVLVAVEYSETREGRQVGLVGLGVTLKLPGFMFFKANLSARKEINLDTGWDDMQLSWAWRYPFGIGRLRFWTDGFGDYIAGWGPLADNLHIISQTKLDLGALRGKPGKYFAGVELDYWRNQFGVQNRPQLDSNSFAASLILRAHF
jgi:nucleoside-specific outer membrane channel protein Tsx